MSADTDPRSPPYSSYTSFKNYLEHLRGHPLPHRIDKSVMSHLNYGTQQALVSALRYLGLLDSNDAPTTRLESLVSAREDERPAVLLEILQQGYPYLWDGLDLSRATPSQLDEKFRAETKVSGSTVEKVTAFFLAAANDAGVALSPHLTKRKSSNGAAKRARAKPRRTRSQAEPEQKDVVPPEKDPPTQDARELLMQKFPNFDPGWPDDLKAKWFAGFERLMRTVEKKV